MSKTSHFDYDVETYGPVPPLDSESWPAEAGAATVVLTAGALMGAQTSMLGLVASASIRASEPGEYHLTREQFLAHCGAIYAETVAVRKRHEGAFN